MCLYTTVARIALHKLLINDIHWWEKKIFQKDIKPWTSWLSSQSFDDTSGILWELLNNWSNSIHDHRPGISHHARKNWKSSLNVPYHTTIYILTIPYLCFHAYNSGIFLVNLNGFQWWRTRNNTLHRSRATFFRLKYKIKIIRVSRR